MKTAVLISGQMRTFAKCYPTQRWQVFRHYEPDIHFFISCLDDEQADSASLLLKHYENVHCERYVDPELPLIPIERGIFAPYANAAPHKTLRLQHWGNRRVFQFFCESKSQKYFDVIIRIRPDLWIHEFQKPPIPFANECYSPWWGKFGGINDRLAIMGETAAFPYFETYDQIDELLEAGCPFHPESLVAASLEKGGVKV